MKWTVEMVQYVWGAMNVCCGRSGTTYVGVEDRVVVSGLLSMTHGLRVGCRDTFSGSVVLEILTSGSVSQLIISMKRWSGA